jgi:hypothetical protein
MFLSLYPQGVTGNADTDDTYDMDITYIFQGGTRQVWEFPEWANRSEDEMIRHYFPYYAFSIAVPYSWYGLYYADSWFSPYVMTQDYVYIYHLPTLVSFGVNVEITENIPGATVARGHLFRILRAPTEFVIPLAADQHHWLRSYRLTESGGYTFGVTLDNVHLPSNAYGQEIECREALSSFLHMHQQYAYVLNSFRFMKLDEYGEPVLDENGLPVLIEPIVFSADSNPW